MDEKLGFTKDDQCRQQYEEVSAAVLVLLSLLQLSLPLLLLLLSLLQLSLPLPLLLLSLLQLSLPLPLLLLPLVSSF